MENEKFVFLTLDDMSSEGIEEYKRRLADYERAISEKLTYYENILFEIYKAQRDIEYHQPIVEMGE